MDEITLASRDRQPTDTIAYSGVLEFDALRELLVARNLEFTKAHRLRKMSQRVLAPSHDELFAFEQQSPSSKIVPTVTASRSDLKPRTPICSI